MASFFITLREIVEFAVILFLLTGIYKDHKKTLLATALTVLIVGCLTTVVTYPLSTFLEQTYSKAMLYSFVVILFLSLISDRKTLYPILCIVLAIFFPSAELMAVLMGKAELLGSSVYIYALFGMLTGCFFLFLCMRYLKSLDLRKFFKTDSIMVFIAAFCFLFGGLDEFDSTSVITMLQKGLNNVLASPRIAMAVTALLLFIPPVYVFIRLLHSPEPVTDSIEVKAEKRKVMSIYIAELIKKGTPLLLSLLVSIVLLHAANLAMNPLFDPEPIPVIADGDEITILLKDNFGDISDGRIRKYSIRNKGNVYRFLVLMRPDNEVVAALDACEICPPTGYVQRGEHVICKYCSTPLPLQSIGQPGGCNPIPVKSRREGDTLVLNKTEIVDTHDKWLGTGSSHSSH